MFVCVLYISAWAATLDFIYTLTQFLVAQQLYIWELCNLAKVFETNMLMPVFQAIGWHQFLPYTSTYTGVQFSTVQYSSETGPSIVQVT